MLRTVIVKLDIKLEALGKINILYIYPLIHTFSSIFY